MTRCYTTSWDLTDVRAFDARPYVALSGWRAGFHPAIFDGREASGQR